MTISRLGVPRSGKVFGKFAILAVTTVLLQGCGSDMGPAPDQTAKNSPPAPVKEPVVKSPAGGGTLKVMDIKKRH
ncbi:MAG: hypothetical protein ACYC61_13615 [Isosphaeraceae bacterium]